LEARAGGVRPGAYGCFGESRRRKAQRRRAPEGDLETKKQRCGDEQRHETKQSCARGPRASHATSERISTSPGRPSGTHTRPYQTAPPPTTRGHPRATVPVSRNRPPAPGTIARTLRRPPHNPDTPHYGPDTSYDNCESPPATRPVPGAPSLHEHSLDRRHTRAAPAHKWKQPRPSHTETRRNTARRTDEPPRPQARARAASPEQFPRITAARAGPGNPGIVPGTQVAPASASAPRLATGPRGPVDSRPTATKTTPAPQTYASYPNDTVALRTRAHRPGQCGSDRPGRGRNALPSTRATEHLESLRRNRHRDCAAPQPAMRAHRL